MCCGKSSVSLLSSGSGTWTTELSWFATSGVSNEEGSIVLEEEVLDLTLLGLINELLVVGDDSF